MPETVLLRTLFDEHQRIVASAAKINRANNERVWANELFTDISAAEKWLTARAKGGYDCYIKFATFDGVLDPKGKPDCHEPHVLGSRSFFVDIDCGQDRQPYRTPVQAINALNQAYVNLKTIKVPPPNLLQKSGGGIQAVWACDEVLSVGEWRVLNGVLYQLLQDQGLKVDPAARALERGVRVCGQGWYNFKTGTARPTELVYARQRIATGRMRAALMPHRIKVVPNSPEGRKLLEQEYGLPGGYQFHIEDVVADCEVLAEADRTQGANHGFARWNLIAALCAKDAAIDEGDAWAKWFSSKHPEYDEAKVETKLNSYRSSGVQELITCKRFAEVAPEACKACRFNGKVVSPGSIPRVKREIEAAKDTLPNDLYVNRSYGLVRVAKDGDVLVWANTRISEVTLSRNPETELVQIAFSVNGRRVSLTNAQFQDGRSLQRVMMQMAAIPVTNPNGVYLAVASWMETLMRRELADSYSRLGWYDDGTFVLGEVSYTSAGDRPFTATDRDMKYFLPVGSLSEFQRIVAMILQNEVRPEMHALLATALGAPLLELIGGVPGMTLNFFSSRSGVGKTLMVKVCTSIYGKSQYMLLGGNDTVNAMYARMATLHSLPAYFDDPDVSDPAKQLASLVFNASRGTEKRRLNSDASQQKGGFWRTLLIFLTNSAFAGTVDSDEGQGDATAARFLDFEVTPLPAGSALQVANFMQLDRALDDHHGLLGPKYIAYLVRNRDKVAKLMASVTQTLLSLTVINRDDVSGRMQAVAGASLIVGAMVAAKQKLLPIDPALVSMAVNRALHNAKRGRITGQRRIKPEDLLRSYIHELTSNRIVTVANVNRGKLLVIDHPRIDLPVAYEVDTNNRKLIVDMKMFEKFLLKRRAPLAHVQTTLSYLAPGRQLQLGTGTPYATSYRDVLVLDLRDKRWQDLDLTV